MNYQERVKDVLAQPSENRSVFSPEFRAKRNASTAVAIAAQADTEIARLVDALHRAINTPKGVVPDIALEFYDPTHPALGLMREKLARGFVIDDF
jgi:hypothetical protein